MDVDGTMYDQRTLRRRMLGSLVRAYLPRPLAGWRALRIIRAWRAAQETLRNTHTASMPANGEDPQLEIACRQSGYDPALVRACVLRWIEQEPLKHIPLCIDPGLKSLLENARRLGIRLAACSDYPARAKLEALGVSHFFACIVCAQDAGVRHFKPHPRMIERALEVLRISPIEAIFLGDRPEVDGAAAVNAEVRYINIVHRAGGRDSWSVTFPELARVLQSPFTAGCAPSEPVA